MFNFRVNVGIVPKCCCKANDFLSIREYFSSKACLAFDPEFGKF